jgi:(p)ppGpp synthase/HD superfamily hydrolase
MRRTRLNRQFLDALAFATRLHRRQVRKGSGVPYVAHLLGTAEIVLHYRGDQEQAIAALLHDGPEDQGGRPTLDRIRRRYGTRVATVVEACTDTFETPKPDWRKRKADYVARLAHESFDALLVSAADKLDNARAVVMDLRTARTSGEGDRRQEVWERFKGKKDGTLEHFRSLVKAYKNREIGPIAAELESAVQQMEALARE